MRIACISYGRQSNWKDDRVDASIPVRLLRDSGNRLFLDPAFDVCFGVLVLRNPRDSSGAGASAVYRLHAGILDDRAAAGFLVRSATGKERAGSHCLDRGRAGPRNFASPVLGHNELPHDWLRFGAGVVQW